MTVTPIRRARSSWSPFAARLVHMKRGPSSALDPIFLLSHPMLVARRTHSEILPNKLIMVSPEAQPTAFARLRGLQNSFRAFALFTAFVSAMMLLHPANSGRPPFHLTSTPIFYCISFITAVMSCVFSLILEFQFDSPLAPSGAERVVAWAPLVLLDISLLAMITGISSWCLNNTPPDHHGALIGYIRILFLACIGLWIWLYLKWLCRANRVHLNI